MNREIVESIHQEQIDLLILKIFAHSNIFILIDGAKISDPEVEATGYDFNLQSLFIGDAYNNLHSVAPYLAWFTSENTQALNYVKETLLPKNACIFLQSELEPSQLIRHLKKYIKAQDEEGKHYYFRFYDPVYTKVWIRHMKDQEDYRFFGGGISVVYLFQEDQMQAFQYLFTADDNTESISNDG